jgi:WD40 repeat protein
MVTGNPAATGVQTSATPLAVQQKKPLWEKRLSKIFWINSVAMSNDGKRVVAGTFIHDYDQRNGKFLPNVQGRFGLHFFDDVLKAPTTPVEPKWSDEFDGCDGVYGVAISGNGQIAAASGWLEKSGNTGLGLLRAYDVDGSSKDNVKFLLDCRTFNQRVSWVSLSEDGRVLAAVADDVYIYIREEKGFNPVPLRLGVGGFANRYVTSVTVHPDGTWVAACDNSGHVHVATIKSGAITSKVTWKAPKEYPFLSVAITREEPVKFVVGGGNLVFLFDLAKLMTNPDTYVPLEFDTAAGEPAGTVAPDKSDGRLQENVRWVAVSADGRLVTAVLNRLNNGALAGKLIALTSELKPLWDATINNNPNSTSIGGPAAYVTMADGWPTSKPAKFYLFNANGDRLWEYDTCSMNWPMFINPAGTAIVAGSDDGTVYYFTP